MMGTENDLKHVRFNYKNKFWIFMRLIVYFYEKYKIIILQINKPY